MASATLGVNSQNIPATDRPTAITSEKIAIVWGALRDLEGLLSPILKQEDESASTPNAVPSSFIPGLNDELDRILHYIRVIHNRVEV